MQKTLLRHSHINKKARGGSVEESGCPPHPGHIGGMCIRCGGKIDFKSGVKVTYIHKDLRLNKHEIARLRDRDLDNLLHHKKLHLVLDLDHTLLNSTSFENFRREESKIAEHWDSLSASFKASLFKVDAVRMITKLRPYVHDFLKEVNKWFELHIYTKGGRGYALEMVKLLDPGDVYFQSRVIAREDCTKKIEKGLDIFLGKASSVLILDDSETVWQRHMDNLILMERYNFFPYSCKDQDYESLFELQIDENEDDGALASILRILRRVHRLYFDQECQENLSNQDVRKVLKEVRKEVLKGCKIVFSGDFVNYSRVLRMAEELGAICSTELDMSVTHLVSQDGMTEKSLWAVNEKKFSVNPRWIEASYYLWLKQPEERFSVECA